MDKREAASFLKVSVRTVERLASTGRLKKGRVVRDNRPVIDFSETDLEALKAELRKESGKEFSSPVSGERPREHVGFRLDPYYSERLAAAGSALGLSPGEYARKLVINAIEDTRAEQLRDEIRSLRLGLASAFYEVSVRGLGIGEDQAQAMIARTILKGWKGA